MQLHYFVVDQYHQLWKVERDALEGLWRGQQRAQVLDCALTDELRVISVLCDERLLPKICFFFRLELDQGQITDKSRFAAYEAVSSRLRQRSDNLDSLVVQYQLSGWPADWKTQLAVAMDVPAHQLQRISVGGPLLMSDLWGVSVEKVVQYFEAACED